MVKNPRILIIDDEISITESIKYLLEYAGFDVSVANNGREAIELVARRKFDATLIDIKMPEMNGVETLSEIKKIQPLIRAFMMTGYALQNLISQAKELGALEILEPELGHSPTKMRDFPIDTGAYTYGKI